MCKLQVWDCGGLLCRRLTEATQVPWMNKLALGLVGLFPSGNGTFCDYTPGNVIKENEQLIYTTFSQII